MSAKTPVLFRVGKSKKDAAFGVTAVFPTLPASPGEMTCYAHVGQHSSCSFGWLATTRPATPGEYSDLWIELKRIGYDGLRIVDRISSEMREVRSTREHQQVKRPAHPNYV